MYGAGISHEGSLLDLGVQFEVVQKSGAFYSFADDRLGQGRNNARQFLRENPDMAVVIEAQVREKAGLPPRPAVDPLPVTTESTAYDVGALKPEAEPPS
jgi:recombination protein RecA